MNDSSQQSLRKFVIDYARSLSAFEYSASNPVLPQFDLYPRDYLEFAEEELDLYQTKTDEPKREKYLIHCISHLKRAMDCELDMFLEAFGLLRTFRKRNLKFDIKLDFLQKAGVFNSRTLSRLNIIRNKMEHEFQVPQVDELEVYFDLVASFVAILERTITFAQYFDINIFDPDEDNTNSTPAWISIKYDRDKPQISATWGSGNNEEGSALCELDEPNSFAFLFKVFILLLQSERFVSSRYIIQRLDG